MYNWAYFFYSGWKCFLFKLGILISFYFIPVKDKILKTLEKILSHCLNFRLVNKEVLQIDKKLKRSKKWGYVWYFVGFEEAKYAKYDRDYQENLLKHMYI